jgi:hypothetical protein
LTVVVIPHKIVKNAAGHPMTTNSAPRTYLAATAFLATMTAVLSAPRYLYADCKEYKIVEYEDRVEAVCVGEPLTEAQIKANQEEQKRLDREAQQKRVEEQNRQREQDRAEKSKAQEEAAAEQRRKGVPPGKPAMPAVPATPPPSGFTPRKLF